MYRYSLSMLLASFISMSAANSHATEPDLTDPLQFSIDAVALADNCLYALQTSRDSENGDCQALYSFHERDYAVWTPNLDALDTAVRRRVLRNRQTYQQTLEDIELERKRLQ